MTFAAHSATFSADSSPLFLYVSSPGLLLVPNFFCPHRLPSSCSHTPSSPWTIHRHQPPPPNSPRLLSPPVIHLFLLLWLLCHYFFGARAERKLYFFFSFFCLCFLVSHHIHSSFHSKKDHKKEKSIQVQTSKSQSIRNGGSNLKYFSLTKECRAQSCQLWD